jgi:nucleotide-binding universal stress UspA family protein
VIVETVRSFEADGIIMATHARTGPAHLMHGSVAEAVLETADVPVFLVQAVPGEAAAPPFDPPAARILVPLDGSPFGAAALSTAMDVLGPNGELVLVRVVAPAAHAVKDERDHVIAYLDQVQDRLNAEASEYLRSMARKVNQDRPEARVRIDVRVGKPVDGIAAAAADHVTDLIVMATHGRTGLRRAVLGSVAGAVLRTSRTPVLMVRPAEAARQAEAAAGAMDVSAFVSF